MIPDLRVGCVVRCCVRGLAWTLAIQNKKLDSWNTVADGAKGHNRVQALSQWDHTASHLHLASSLSIGYEPGHAGG